MANVDVSDMPAVGPLPPEQLGLFFNSESTKSTTSKDHLNFYIERSQQDYGLELKSQNEITLNGGQKATLAVVNGGHPGPKRDFYLFVYVKDGVAITTSYESNSNHKETALRLLKTIR